MSWGSESPKTSWSQQREHHLIVPLNSETVESPDNYHITGNGLFLLFIIHYVFIFSYIQK
jgi:hypothetical protein